MELKIYSPQEDGFAKVIQWNYEELKKEVAETAHGYEVSVYTDDTIKQARADRAKLNKFVDAINGKRTEIRKKLLEPDEQFGKEVKELTGVVEKAISSIDSQIKNFEERQRAEKKEKVLEFYEASIYDLAEVLPFNRVFKPEYANASTTMKSIKDDILELIQKVSEGLAIISEVDSKFSFEMKEVFLKTYDIGAAMMERNRLEAEEQKRKEYEAERARIKAEREERARQEAGKVIAAGTAQSSAKAPEQAPKIEAVEDPVHILDFRVRATQSQLDKLKLFLVETRIQFGPVPREEN